MSKETQDTIFMIGMSLAGNIGAWIGIYIALWMNGLI